MDFFTQQKGTKSIKEYDNIRAEYGSNALVLNNAAFREMGKGYFDQAYYILKSFESDHTPDDTNLLATCSFFIGNYNEAYKNFNKIDSPSSNLKLFSNYIQNFLEHSPRISNFQEVQNKEQSDGLFPEEREVDAIFNKILQSVANDIDISSFESIRNICYSPNKIVMEKNAFAFAEKLFIAQNYFHAMLCYNLAMECNPNKALYRGFQAQTRLRMAQNISKEDISFATNLIDGLVLIESAISLDYLNARWYFIKLNIMLSLTSLGFSYSQAQMFEQLDTIERLITTQNDIVEMLPKLNQVVSNLK